MRHSTTAAYVKNSVCPRVRFCTHACVLAHVRAWCEVRGAGCGVRGAGCRARAYACVSVQSVKQIVRYSVGCRRSNAGHACGHAARKMTRHRRPWLGVPETSSVSTDVPIADIRRRSQTIACTQPPATERLASACVAGAGIPQLSKVPPRNVYRPRRDSAWRSRDVTTCRGESGRSWPRPVPVPGHDLRRRCNVFGSVLWFLVANEQGVGEVWGWHA